MFFAVVYAVVSQIFGTASFSDLLDTSILRSRQISESQRSECWELPLSDHIGDLDAVRSSRGESERLEPAHVPDASFDESVTLFHDVVIWHE